MIVQAFVPDWPGPKQHAKEVAAVIAPHCPVTILDDPNDYFNAQFEKARAQFTGDILLWVMADVQPPSNFGEMFEKAVSLMSTGEVGWYAPDVAWTSYIYDKEDLREYKSGIYEVPNTDSLCVFIHKNVLGSMPHLRPDLCYMWGADLTAIGTARVMGLKVVRDYAFKAKHPNHTGYDIEKAGRGMQAMFSTYPLKLKQEIDVLESETRKLRKSIWKGKNVVVTGGAGFLGRHVVDYLKEWRDCENIFVPRVENFDLRVRQDVELMYESFRPDIVIHLAAAVGGLGANIANPGKFFYDNLIMGMQMLDVARERGVDKFVQMGSACEYPKDCSIPLQEKDVWSGYPEPSNAPYGIAKRSLLAMGDAYRQQYGMNVIHILSTNLYGPGDNFDLSTSHVIPALINRCVAAKAANAPSVTVWGTGNATRDFIFVKDAAEGIVLSTEYYNNPAPFNLGSGQEISIREIAEKIKSITGFQGDIVWDGTKPDGQPRRLLDVSRAASFGFKSQTSLDQGLKETVEWYRAR